MLNIKNLILSVLAGKKTKSVAVVQERKEKISNVRIDTLMRNDYRPNIYDIMRALASKRYKSYGKSGFRYRANNNSAMLKAKRLIQIEKGMIQVSPERQTTTKQEASSGRNS